MPSPVGHFIGGVAAGWLVAGAPPVFASERRALSRTFWREALVFGSLGAMPDLDLLGPLHRGPSHSLAAAVFAGGIFWLVVRKWGGLSGTHRARFAVASAAAYASHVLLDWLGHDTSAPFGIMALWPASRAYFEAGVHLFLPISRRYHQGWPFVQSLTIAVAREVAILGPALAIIIATRRRPAWREER